MLPERACVIGLGSNLGDRLGFLQTAVRGLANYGQIRGLSALYETAPVGPPQPDYLNAAVSLSSSLPALELLSALLGLEQQAGRERRERWGPRTLDLDLLFIVGEIVSVPTLSVPHPELSRRAFALLPLLDVAPEACAPESGEPYARLVEVLDRTGVREVPGSRAGWLESSLSRL